VRILEAVADASILELLRAGEAFVDLSRWRKVGVGGTDALAWLDALVSADLDGLAPGRAKRSLLLSPTGRVRADFTVAGVGGSIVLLQDPIQRSILELLSPYVLSSDVELEDRSDALALFAMPNRDTPPGLPGGASSVPSCVGPGVDVIVAREERASVFARLSNDLTLAGPDDLERWRVLSGLPRVGIDVLEQDLPQEGGLTDAVSFDKGCFTGQEAVAKVRNLGHPRRALAHLEASERIVLGDPVLVDGREAGQVTSVAERGGVYFALARIGWDARVGSIRTSGGSPVSLLRTL